MKFARLTTCIHFSVTDDMVQSSLQSIPQRFHHCEQKHWTHEAITPHSPRWCSSRETVCQCRRCKRRGFQLWVGKIPWRREWQPTPVFLPGKSHGQRTLVGYSPWGHRESDMTELTLLFSFLSPITFKLVFVSLSLHSLAISYKWNHIVFVRCVWLTSLTIMFSGFICIVACVYQNFIPFMME